jgi:hypothetical protein
MDKLNNIYHKQMHTNRSNRVKSTAIGLKNGLSVEKQLLQ